MLVELLKETNQFLNNIFNFTTELGIGVDDYSIDHIALRYKDSKDVSNLALELDRVAKCISEAEINSRLILLYKLNGPIEYKGRKIDVVELPYPALNHNYPKDGWEHVEFVLPCNKEGDFENIFKNTFRNLSVDKLKKYNYVFASPRTELDLLANPTCSLSKYKGLTIKFHPYSIEDIVLARKKY